MDLTQLPISEEGSPLNTGDLPDRMGVIRFASPCVPWRATLNALWLLHGNYKSDLNRPNPTEGLRSPSLFLSEPVLSLRSGEGEWEVGGVASTTPLHGLVS